MAGNTKRATLAGLIERRKTVLGESDAQAARALAVGQPTFTRWRNGTLFPVKSERVDALAEWLNVDRDAVVLAIEEGKRERPVKPRDLRSVVLELTSVVRELTERLERLESRG